MLLSLASLFSPSSTTLTCSTLNFPPINCHSTPYLFMFQVLTSKELWAAEAVRLQHEREARDRKVAEEQAIKLRTVRPLRVICC